ncbi:4-hydroxyproline epimerase [Parahaliea sp. F7430]|uniref:4-hydroxyproline epimerase n=1 Tax=Sediminihaliea albiluteola TaxID=2758564 RepID=A0A7W2TY03_9GAMM|nr:4-hydroxyproline epimerase [Sediminihaliea albiluteola]MBA6413879.1 4-hydroxyproline epimerase [Sediminihaliea albiluteola]
MQSSHHNSKPLRVIDSHTAGEVTRLVVSGGPALGQGSMSERLQRLKNDHDWLRRALLNEPRGSEVMVGALLCEPQDPANTAGVIFFNNVGYLGMCGHGTIGLLASLAYLQQIEAGEQRIETPVGTVHCTLHDRHKVSVNNVDSYRYREAVALEVPGHGLIHGDIAWGGNWFFLVSDHGQRLAPSNTDSLTQFASAVRQSLARAGITGDDGAEIDHIELFGPPYSSEQADSCSFVLCPGNAYDRSPCGTGTSAKLACLQASGELQAGQVWRQQSIIGSVFEGSFQLADQDKISPTITGTAYVNGELTLIMEEDDPFKYGIPTD